MTARNGLAHQIIECLGGIKSGFESGSEMRFWSQKRLNKPFVLIFAIGGVIFQHSKLAQKCVGRKILWCDVCPKTA